MMTMANALTRAGLAGLALSVGLGMAGLAHAAEGAAEPPAQEWSFNGFFGTFDRASAQRGFQVYREVCSTCHSLRLLSYRDLEGLGYSEEEVAAVAAEYRVTDGPNDEGEMFERAGIAADRFVSPYDNEQAARVANNGALPPDLSVIAKAREGGTDYLVAFLTGFHEPPEDVTLLPGMYWNAFYPGHQVAMPNILTPDSVTYADGTPATLAQEAYDVANFLMWAAEPHLEERKEMGVKVVLFLVVFSGLMYSVKRKLWADVH